MCPITMIFVGILQQPGTEKNTGCFLGDLKMSYGLRLLKIKYPLDDVRLIFEKICFK